MLRVLSAALLVLAAQTADANAQPRTRVAVAETFERLASEIVVLGPNEFVHGFRDTRLPTEGRLPVQRFTQFLERSGRPADDLLPLLRHADARVRSLALIAVYNLEDPRLLPRVLPLVGDAAQTFPALRPFANCCMADTTITPQLLEPQTVGDLATAILRIYLESGGYFYGPQGIRGQPGFDEYWKARAGRTSAAGWWSVRLARAGHATIPTPKGRLEAIRRLRARIDRLSQPDRTYILLWLHGDEGSDALASTEELLKLSQSLGADNLLDVLKRRIRSDDPDLQARPGNNHRYARMSLFVLQHARALLRPGDATALLEQEIWERDYQNHRISDPLLSPWWAIASAQLNEPTAHSVLTAAYSRFQQEHEGWHRLELAWALWRQLGESQAPTVVDWFYRELAHPNGQEARALENLLNTEGRSAGTLLKTLTADPRFDELNWRSVEALVKWMNARKGATIVPEEELQSIRSPIGVDFYMKDRDKALAQHPKEVETLLLTLSRWRQILRQNVSAGL